MRRRALWAGWVFVATVGLSLRPLTARADPAPTAPPSYAAPPPAAAPAPALPAAAAPPPMQAVPGYWQPAPPTLPYREDEPMPPGYRLVERSRTGLIVAGAIVVGVPYVIGLSFATRSNGSNGAAWLLVPGIGPWLAIGARRDACDRANVDGSLACAADVLATTGLVFDGLIQTTGAVLLIVGLTVPKKVLVRQDVAAKLKLAPVGSGYGLAAVGTF